MRTRSKSWLGGLALVAVTTAGCGGTASEDSAQAAPAFPQDNITLVIPYGTGGATDPLGRAFAGELEKILGKTVVVENREGGGATLGTGTVVGAKADGYTIGMASGSVLSSSPLVNPQLPWDSVDDYTPLVKLVGLPGTIGVRADAPWKTLEEFLEESKKRQVQVSVPSLGSTPNYVVAGLNEGSGAKLKSVPFSGGGGEALLAMLSGRVDAVSGTAVNLKPHIEAGKARALTVVSTEKYDYLPDVARSKDSGVDRLFLTDFVLLAPKGLPDNVEKALIDAASKAVKTEAFRAFASENGYLVEDEPTSGSDLADYLRTEQEAYAKSELLQEQKKSKK
jgi:tripartite-type tricarboxylate transporter receptor subunit TctC